jgi:hypothetical protein
MDKYPVKEYMKIKLSLLLESLTCLKHWQIKMHFFSSTSTSMSFSFIIFPAAIATTKLNKGVLKN